jgi:pimeloyl-ACP methyl ester carboxylesterase
MTMPKSDGGDAHTGASSVGAPHLVFVHGFLDDSSIWDATVSELGLGPDTVTRVDLVGADAERGRASTVEHLAADVVEVIEKRDGPVVLVGQSMGAQVAELAAAATAERTVALVLVTPVPLSGMRLPDPVAVSFKSLANDYEAQCKARTDLSVALTPEAVKNLAQRGITIPAISSVRWWTPGISDLHGATKRRGFRGRYSSSEVPVTPSSRRRSSRHRATGSRAHRSSHWRGPATGRSSSSPARLRRPYPKFLTEHVSSSLAVEASPVTKPRS